MLRILKYLLNNLSLLIVSLFILLPSFSYSQFDEDDIFQKAFGFKKKEESTIASFYIDKKYIADLKILNKKDEFIVYSIQALVDELKNQYNSQFIKEFEHISQDEVAIVNLDRFQDILTYEYLEGSHRVNVVVESKYRKQQIWNRNDDRRAILGGETRLSWFLNSFLNQNIGENDTRSGDFDSSLSFLTMVVEGRWNTDFSEKLDSLYYRFVKDIPDIPLRLTLGDTNYQVIGQQKNFLTTGISLESNYNLQPYTRFFPQAEKDFYLKNDAWVNVMLNGRFYSRKFLKAGSHTVKELPILIGQNAIEIQIEEENGRKESINFTETGSLNVFKKGAHFFSYSLGNNELALSDRYQGAVNSFNSLFSFYHLYGYRNYLTIGGYGQLAQDEKVLAAVVNWRSNLFNGDASIVQAETEKVVHGRHLELNLNQTYWLDRKRKGFNLRTSFSGKGYKRIDETPLEKDRFLIDLTVNWQIGSGYFSSFGGRWESFDRFSGRDASTIYAQLSKNTSRWGSQLRLEQSSEDNFAFEFNFNYYWGKSRQTVSQYQYSSKNKNHQLRTTYATPNRNRGVQVDSQLIKGEMNQSQQLDIDYTHERLLASVDVGRSGLNGEDKKTQANLKLASAVSFVDGAWGFSRPIGDSFAIVNVEGSKKEVLVNPSNRGENFESKVNNINGVLPQLNSYTIQSVKVEGRGEETLKFENNRLNIVPTYKTGYLLNFMAKGDRFVKGILYDEGKLVKLNVFTLKSVGSDSEDVSFTDEDGRFWLDGVKPGKYYIEWYDKKTKEFIIEGDEVFVNIGNIELSEVK